MTLLSVLGFSGCAGPFVAPVEIVTDVPAEAQRIMLAKSSFNGEVTRYAVYQDSWQREDYAVFAGDVADEQAEMIYASTAPGLFALEFPFAIESSLEVWPALQARVRDLGPAIRVQRPDRVAFARAFRLEGDERSCIGFTSTWDNPGGDRFRRPGQALFGYYCADADVPLTEAAMRQFLRDIEVTKRLEAPPPLPATQAIRLAGNPSFPFRFARAFVLSDGDRRSSSD